MNSEQILEALKLQGKISQEDIVEAVGMTPEYRTVVDLCENLFNKDDASVEKYSMEASSKDCWDKDEHKVWRKKVAKLMSFFKRDTVELGADLAMAVKTFQKFEGTPCGQLLSALYYPEIFQSFISQEEQGEALKLLEPSHTS